MTTILEGLMKAVHFLQLRARRTGSKHPKYAYESIGTVVHATRCLTTTERTHLNDLLVAAQEAADNADLKAIMKEIAGMPVKFVPFKRANLQDHSKYPGDKLRKIYAERGIRGRRYKAAA